MNLFEHFAVAFAPETKKTQEKIMSANTMLCDGDCGNIYYEIDLAEACYKQMLCRDCMFTFTADQECKQSEIQQKI